MTRLVSLAVLYGDPPDVFVAADLPTLNGDVELTHEELQFRPLFRTEP